MKRRLALLLLWLLTDALFFIGSYVLAYFLRVGWVLSSQFPFVPYLKVVTLVTPLWLLVLITTRTFALGKIQTTPRNTAYIAYSCLVGTAFFALGYYFLYNVFFSRLLLLESLILSTAVVWTWHIVFEQIGRWALTQSPPAFPTLIVGVTRESRHLIALLREHRNPLVPVAVLDATGVKDSDIEGVPVLGKLNKLEETLALHHITHLIQCSDLEQSLNLLSACRSRGITYLLLPSVLGIVERDEKIESLEGRPVTMVSPASGWWNWFF